MAEKVIKWIDRLSDFFAYLSAFLLIIIIILIVANITLMSLTGKSIMITDEYSAYMFAGFVMFGLAYTLKNNGHIRINVLTSRMPPKVLKLFRYFADVVALALTVYIFYYSAYMVYQAYVYQMRSDTVAQTLLWIPQLVMPIGFFVLALQLIAEILRESIR